MLVLSKTHFAVGPGEEITIRVIAHNTAFAVGCSINGVAGPALQNATPFTFRPAMNPTQLLLTGAFSESGGGHYEVEIRGSQSATTATDRLEQIGGSIIDIHEYQFPLIVGVP
jgi:hypothetical protein